MDNNTQVMDHDNMGGLSVLETVRPKGLIVRMKRWFEGVEAELRDMEFEVDPLLDFPRDL